MLINATHLKGLTIRATDGDIGTVDEFYFDDATWGIRYFVVDLQAWPGGRKVLIAPHAVLHADWQAGRLSVALEKKQVEKSPDIDTRLPVSRQYEIDYLDYYGYPYYWGDPLFRGPGVSSSSSPAGADQYGAAKLRNSTGTAADCHLRSSAAVTGYDVEATNGEMGHVAGFVVDDEAWSVRYLEVATRNWWPGKKVLVSPDWIARVSWMDSKVYTALSRDAITGAPEYSPDEPVSRDYEDRLYSHYGRPPYWTGRAETVASAVGQQRA